MHETLNKLKVFARKVGDITTNHIPYVWHTNVWTGVKHLAFILSNNLPQFNNEMQMKCKTQWQYPLYLFEW